MLKGNKRGTIFLPSFSQFSQKCKDLWTFSIPYIIDDSEFENDLLDLGSSINIMSISIFNTFALASFIE